MSGRRERSATPTAAAASAASNAAVRRDRNTRPKNVLRRSSGIRRAIAGK